MLAKPMGDYVLVKEIGGEETTSGGIIITEHTKTHSKGEVISVGTGLFTQTGDKIPMTTEVGDTVLFHPGGGKEIKLEDTTYKLIRESEMFMVVKND